MNYREGQEWGGEMVSHILRFGGQVFTPLPSGGLYWHARRTLLVADLHLEKHAAFARTGQFLPPYDTTMTLKRLAADLSQTGAESVVALGDSFHRDHGTESLSGADRALLGDLMAAREWHWLSGNHDPSPHRLGGICRAALEIGGLRLAHMPEKGRPGLVAGHLHPAARVVINGRSTRRPCFVHDGRLMILPAYGASTGSINILGKAFAGLFDRSALEITMLGRGQLYPVSARRLVDG
ncbi:ligase-associated DNA damage response endonuclease PdeM [Arsenicitalea aurantiaca]|uniref:Ligase-associated DNA damage response endonuclease PdeM n=1 Tax=Arsenicitalea aurantiaca TaxID=1783274 RepID=A0A433XK99_9HYPH|nr:ligase-associated DNA damage response endonuclease PdeM [Arsenicitalea aurantiaca]RUT34506.1 ligase-associated DNA damage response endonuclease PdeM [Arsenicitalea aurantiaca]